MKILVVCRAIDNMAGGVERMSTALINDMAERKHEVSLLTWDLNGAKSFYEINNKTKWYKLNDGDPAIKASLFTKMRRAFKVRKILKNINPDIIIAFQDGPYISTRLYGLGMGYPVILAERNAPSRYNHIKAGKKKNFIFQTYRLAKSITIQCESYRNDYPKYLKNKIVTIPNPVFPVSEFAAPNKGDKKILLSVGRLGYQKNYSSLINAYAKIANKYDNWKLIIVGEGEEREKLETLISRLDMHQIIILEGAKKNVSDYYIKSHLFCLPARWEGFPNALGEAMSHGLPCIGYKECSGVNDLIDNGTNGLLSDGNGDVDSLSHSLDKLMADDNLRKEMGNKAIKSMKQYKPSKIYDMWEDFFKKSIKK